jgi:gentisate 1,2-dioxygenase
MPGFTRATCHCAVYPSEELMPAAAALKSAFEPAQSWEADAQFKEYMSAVNPAMPRIDVAAFPAALHAEGATRLIPFDLSAALRTTYPATTPNLYAGYLRILAGEQLRTEFVAASQMFFVISGSGSTSTDDGAIIWNTGDLLTLPATDSALHEASADSVLFWVNDAPLLRYLGVTPCEQRFKPVLYTQARITEALNQVRAQGEDRNRVGVLLSNPNFPTTMTLTHTLWSLYNILPKGVVQKAHRHNSIAIDHCVAAGPDTYTLIGKDVDADGTIINPIKAMWTPGATFITPPGWWHSHHNDSSEEAIVLPIQDAGLVMNMQVLDFRLVD